MASLCGGHSLAARLVVRLLWLCGCMTDACCILPTHHLDTLQPFPTENTGSRSFKPLLLPSRSNACTSPINHTPTTYFHSIPVLLQILIQTYRFSSTLIMVCNNIVRLSSVNRKWFQFNQFDNFKIKKHRTHVNSRTVD